MSKLIRLDTPPIKPIYLQAAPNQSIDLGKTEIEFTHEKKPRRESAKVIMDFVPRENLWFIIPMDIKLMFSMFDQDDGISFTLTDRGTSADVFYSGFNFGEGPGTFISKRSPITVTAPSDAISSVTSHLFNFPDFLATEDYILVSGEPPLQGGKRCGRVTLRANGWRVAITAFKETSDLVKSLKEQGGYAVTHMAKIEREDGSLFSTKDAEDLLECMHLFLSFALGRWAGVALPVGLDADGNRVFEQWGLPLSVAGSWHGSFSWFDDRHGEILSGVFPGFLTLWNDSSWRDYLRKTLYWYLAANERSTGIGVDAGIVLAQTALERLAWAHCVQHQKIVTPDAFAKGRLKAADQIRMLSVVLGIPLELPSTGSALTSTPGRKWVDIPDAITAIRNALVHPSEEKSFVGSSHYFEAWKLSMWLLDLALLRLCNHGGDYANRTIHSRYSGQVERVPWA